MDGVAPVDRVAGDRAAARGPVPALARAVVVSLAVTAAIDVWSVVAQLHRASLMDAFDVPQPSVSLETVRAADHQVTASAIVGALATLVTGILFITWLYRIVRRLVVLRRDVLRHSPGWAIGAWFVPFLNLVRPKQIVDDSWRATVPPGDWDVGPPARFHFWWAAFLIASFTSTLSARLPSNTPSALATADRVGAAGDAIDIVAAALAISVVVALARRVAGLAASAAAADAYRFNPPPGWPVPPPGWRPPPGWQPDPAWPSAPPGWEFWLAPE